MPPHPSETPAKKQSKWSADEDALIIQLRGDGMKWEDISKRLPDEAPSVAVSTIRTIWKGGVIGVTKRKAN